MSPRPATPKRIARGGMLVIAANVTGLGLKFLFQLILGRTLGPAQYGLFALGQSVVKFLQIPAQLGWHNGVVRFGAAYRAKGEWGRLRGLMATCFASVALLGVALGAALFLLSGTVASRLFSDPDLAPVLRIFALWVPFLALLTVVAGALRAFHRGDLEVGLREGFHSILMLGTGGAILALGGGLLEAAWAPVAATGISLAAAFALLARLYPGLLGSMAKTAFEFGKQHRYVLVLALIALSNYFIIQIDRIVIGALRPSADVGIYNAAALVGMQTGLFLASLNTMFSPLISDLHARGKMDELDDLFKTITKWVVTLTLPLTLFACFTPGHILSLFGPRFNVPGGTRSLVVLAVMNFINVGVGSVGFILLMTGRHKFELLNGLVLGLLNLVLNVLFVSWWGILGAAVATGISVALINLARLAEVYLLHGLQPYRRDYLKLLPPLGALLLYWILAGFLIPDSILSWILISLGSLPVYFGAVYLTGLDETDREILQAVKRRVLGD